MSAPQNNPAPPASPALVDFVLAKISRAGEEAVADHRLSRGQVDKLLAERRVALRAIPGAALAGSILADLALADFHRC